MSDLVGFTPSGEGQEERNTAQVEIRCMTPPSEQQRERLRALLMAERGCDDVEFVIKKDPAAGDGFNIFVGDDNYDWSTLGRIRQLRRSLQALPRQKQFDGIISLLREDIRGFELHTGHQQVGQVRSVGDGIAVISGLHEVCYGEIVLLPGGVKGMVQDLRADGTAGVVLFAGAGEISAGDMVLRTRRTAGVPISSRILGRMIDPLGAPIDGGGPIDAKEYFPLERPAPGIVDRQSVTRPMETGILAIDAMFPIGRGQRELIIGDRETGKTTIA
ncbi:MAG: F0F1 ATP synthase subunit alpha, partial [Ruminococcaceae bacterium]|nr:F0F1 ATP synthase subunit alpha [Oscillospiraceae bacterium]